MKTGNGYMTRALKSNDPRYARVLSKLGYNRSDMVAEKAVPAKQSSLAELRAEYQRIVGKRPFNGWDASELRAKITAAKGE
jgi:hypothetical protein